MKSVALLTLGLFIACCPAMAKSHHGHRHVTHTAHHALPAHHRNLAHGTHHAQVAARHAAVEGESHSGITCEMVRAYVAQVGLAQAAAMAHSAGITSAEKERARRCLAQKS
ncbi:MAG TPA: hypothetical protein VGG01_24675 [Xanthobacteraceae bacterium]|jgi:hypothetical protein